MRKLVFCAVLAISIQDLYSQNTESFGIFGGFNVPITIDKGLEKDPRYRSKFEIRGTPIGFHYGYDRPGFGYVISPSFLKIGQTYTILNATGGDVGTRDISMNYFSLPLALKFHLNDLSFFRLSLLAAADFCFLLDGTETINNSAAKLRYPSGVTVPDGYTVAYDGVFVPAISNQVYVSKDKFNSFQLFGAIGMRADLDLSDNWSVMVDGRANFSLFDPRSKAYLDQLSTPSGGPDINGNTAAPDLYGQRRDVFLSVTFGVSRIIQTKAKFKERHTAPLPKVNYSKTVGGKKPKK
ncbi:MAG: outer membrane beta-barrel protein [Cyclobacteriaceae bacterium]|nr:outer membrane beta-barrel protein [Cyclobacteriaceae bacterium]